MSSSQSRQYPLELFLLATHFPDFESVVPISELTFGAGPLTAAAGSRREQIVSYWNELRSMPADQLLSDCATVRERARRRIELELKISDYLLDVNYPEAAADYDWWVKHDFLTIAESVALLLGKDPRRFNLEKFKEHVKTSAFARRFADFLELLQRAQLTGQLSSEISPQGLVEWAEGKLEVPREFKTALDRLPARRPTPQSEIQALTSQTERLVAENEKLKSNQELNPKIKLTFYKVLLGMAIIHYKYKLGAPMNSAARAMDEALTRVELRVSDDALRKHLRNAEEEVGPEATER